MLDPSFHEWLAALPASERQKALALLARFRALGANDPQSWVRSEVSENLAQFTRYLVLRQIWPDHIESWTRSEEWIERVIKAYSKPNGQFADAGHALRKMIEAGVPAADLGALARMIAFETAFGILNRIDEGYDHAAGDDAPGWILMETDASGTPTGRTVGGLHESLLSLDPTEGEPKPS
jgi:hypothetical protein